MRPWRCSSSSYFVRCSAGWQKEMGEMEENGQLKQETLTDSESRVSGQVEVSAAATTADAVVLKAGSRRGTSFSWFRLIVAIAAVGMLFMAIAPRVPGLKGLLGERPVTW